MDHSTLRDAWRYRATLRKTDGRRVQLTSPDVRADPRWMDEDMALPIERLEFFLPTGHTILMTGMEAYCLFLEVSETFSGRFPKLEAVWICGKLPERQEVEMWRIGQGKVVRQRKPYGKEWGGTAVAGWKPGVVGGKVISKVV